MNQKLLKCANCGNEFVWSEEEQKLYKERNIDDPKYCPICRGMMEAKKKHEEERKT